MNKLFTFGCSNTYGHGLRDITDEKTGKLDMPLRGPSKLAYPQILADMLGYECVNISMPASSNKLIAYRATDQKIDKDDIVIFQWTYLLRSCILAEIDPSEQLDERVIYMHRQSIKAESKKPAMNWVKWNLKFSNDYNLINENMVWASMANKYAERFTKNIYNYSSNGGVLLNKAFQNRYSMNILQDLNPIMDSYPKALDGSHPGEKAHQHIANLIYKNIKENK
jgi:hypothetical protein